MSLAGWEAFERRHIVLTGLRAFGTSVLVLIVYFVVPISNHPRGSVVVRLSVGLAFFIAALLYEVRAIMRSARPMLRAADALALVVPVFVVVFAWTYLTIARSDPTSFSQPLNRVSSLYFTVTVFSTVGFGDITPTSDPARVVAMIQMLGDLVFIAVVVRLIFEAARGTFGTGTDVDTHN
jgi:ion channel